MKSEKPFRKPDWEPGGDNSIPGGRDNGKSIVDTFYANVHPELKYSGCTAYADPRELFDKEKDLNSVKIMTPDHLHGILCMAAMKRGKNVLVHKPLSNRLLEGKKVIAMARDSKVDHAFDSLGFQWLHGNRNGLDQRWRNRKIN